MGLKNSYDKINQETNNIQSLFRQIMSFFLTIKGRIQAASAIGGGAVKMSFGVA